MSDEELIPEPNETEEAPEDEFNQEAFNMKLQAIREIMEVVTGGETVGARVSPVLSPKNPNTSSILTRGEIEMCLSFIEFGKLEPEETYPAIDFVAEKLALNLSLDGRGLDYAIRLGQALTQRDSSTRFVESPSSPTEGMSKK